MTKHHGSYKFHQQSNVHGFIARPGDHRVEMMRSMPPALVNASFGAASKVQVAMMPVIPKDKPLLAPVQTPACHHVRKK